jgi:hypothetical protein
VFQVGQLQQLLATSAAVVAVEQIMLDLAQQVEVVVVEQVDQD